MTNPARPNPAQIYERYFVPAMFLPWTAALLRHADPQAGERVLDVACGTGIVARQIAPLVGTGGRVAALDINPAMLDVARAQPPSSGAAIQWDLGNAMSLPYVEGEFDLALCQHGLQFFPQRVDALAEMRRVLAPTGRLCVIVLQALAHHPVFEALMSSVARHLELPLSVVSTPFGLSDADDLRDLITAAGFRTVDVHPEMTTVRFPEASRFVPLAVGSSAAAVPAFAQLQAPQQAALIENVRADVEKILPAYRDDDAITFTMFAHVAVGSC